MNKGPRAIVGGGLLIAMLFCSTAFCSHEVVSPDGSLRVAFEIVDGRPSYSVARKNHPLIRPSRLGFRLVDSPPLEGNFEIVSTELRSHESSWQQPWGEDRVIDCIYNELRVELRQRDTLQRRMAVVFRVFDEGIGFRYEWPEQPSLTRFAVAEELTEFVLADQAEAWWIPAYQSEHYEYLYRKTPIAEMPIVHTPATLETERGVFLSLHEAALIDFPSMTLERTGPRTIKANLAPWSDGVKARLEAPRTSPWRTLRVANDAGGLVTNHLELNLNEPNRLGDTSWIKPGKYIGIWWEMHLGKSTWGSGPRHGATNENVRRYIDFAAEHGFDGVLVEGWNLSWDGDWIKNGDKFSFTKSYPDYDLPGLAQYAHDRGVRLIGHNETGGAAQNYERQLDEAYELYERLGIGALKTGYVNFADGLPRFDESAERHGEWHYGQYMVRHHHRVVEAAAARKLMLDVHEPVKQTGLRRTYPNLMTAEGARGQEYNAWSADGGNPPEHVTILPFTRLLAGPMDFTPGIFDLTYTEARPNNRVNTTLAKQLALYVVIYSPLHMAADLPENYVKRLDAFRFIKEVPTDWETTHVLHAKIGDYVTIARRERGGDDWYLGSVTDEQGRSLEADLSFLDPGRQYTAQIYRDAKEADWESNPTAYEIESVEVNSQTKLPLILAPGGGQAIRFVAD